MKVYNRKKIVSFVAAVAVTLLLCTGSAWAENTSIAVLDMQKVVLNSNYGKAAQIEIEQRVKELETTFKKDEADIAGMQAEFEKKSSVWSEEVKRDKALEIQKLRRDMRIKQDDANQELKQLQEKKLAPIFQELEGVVKKFAKDKGYQVILPGQAVLYAVEGVDITNEITQALNASAKK